jgi:hypothetical protein
MIDQQYLETLHATAQAALLTAQSCLKAIELAQIEANENKWVTIESAAAALGDGISVDMLKERCTDGRFKYGLHFTNTSDGKRGNYLVKVSAVRKFFETPPEKRVNPIRKAS